MPRQGGDYTHVTLRLLLSGECALRARRRVEKQSPVQLLKASKKRVSEQSESIVTHSDPVDGNHRLKYGVMS